MGAAQTNVLFILAYLPDEITISDWHTLQSPNDKTRAEFWARQIRVLNGGLITIMP